MRLIDADVLFQHKVVGEIGNLSGDFVPGFAIAQAPTIDAVEVVRCRECKYKHVPRCCPYQITGYKVDEDWYCPMGVRRADDGTQAD